MKDQYENNIINDHFYEMLDNLQFNEAKDYLEQALKSGNVTYLILIQLSNVLYNLEDNENALKYAKMALIREKRDALVFFTLGRIYMALYRFKSAIKQWDKILTMKIDDIACGDIARGYGWAQTIYNDSRYYKSICLNSLNKRKEAVILMQDHLQNRKRGIRSDFSKKAIELELKMVKTIKTNSNLAPLKKTSDNDGFMTDAEGAEFQKKLDYLKEKKDNIAIKTFLENEAAKHPNEHFIFTELSRVCIFLDLTVEAIEYSEKAMEIEDNDPLVIYNYGLALSSGERSKDAIKQWNKILNKDIDEIAYGVYGEGLKSAKSTINDSRYMKAVDLINIGNKNKAKILIKEHLLNRQRGIYSDFTKTQVIKKLKNIC